MISHRNQKLPIISKAPFRLRPLPASVALALSLSMGLAQAATINVNSTSDTANDVCRLRDAIIAAETDVAVQGCSAGSGADTVSLREIAGNTITLEQGELETLSSTVTIEGANVTVDANGGSRVIKSSGTVTISNLSLTGGSVAGSGGAIRVTGGSFELIGSTISGNAASINCGGIDVDSALFVRLTNSTFSGNTATNHGGGICFHSVGDGALINSTVSGNEASIGGGVHLSNIVRETINLTNSTLTGNSAAVGAGLYREKYGPAMITNSIIANSIGGEDCFNASIYSPQAFGVNLVEDGGSDCFPPNPSSLLTGDPLLGNLGSNGGPTLTHSLLAGSEAINAVAGDCPVTHDQRGFGRTDGMCDLGAFEVDGVALQPGPDFEVNVISDDDDGHCNPLPGDCTLREAIDAADVDLDASIITFALALPARIALTSNTSLPTVTSNITIQSQSLITLDGDCRENPNSGSACAIRPLTVASSAGHLAINDLIIRNGYAEDNGGTIAVLDSATFEMTDSMVLGSSANLRGGAIYAGPGTQVTLTRSTLSGSLVCSPYTEDFSYGAGIFVGAGAILTLDSSQILDNSNFRTVCFTNGGGVFVNSGTAILTDVSLSGNSTNGSGGGIGAKNSTVTINNSTISGNYSGDGSGLHLDGGLATLTNSTLSGNGRINSAGGGISAKNGGIVELFNSTLWGNGGATGASFFSQGATIQISNSIIANSLGGGDCWGGGSPISTLGVNLIEGGGADCGITSGPNLLTGDAGMAPLTDNGGPTLTHAPGSGSQVLDAGDDAEIPAGLIFDQRGEGYSRIAGSSVDLGAVEWRFTIFQNGFESPD